MPLDASRTLFDEHTVNTESRFDGSLHSKLYDGTNWLQAPQSHALVTSRSIIVDSGQRTRTYLMQDTAQIVERGIHGDITGRNWRETWSGLLVALRTSGADLYNGNRDWKGVAACGWGSISRARLLKKVYICKETVSVKFRGDDTHDSDPVLELLSRYRARTPGTAGSSTASWDGMGMMGSDGERPWTGQTNYGGAGSLRVGMGDIAYGLELIFWASCRKSLDTVRAVLSKFCGRHAPFSNSSRRAYVTKETAPRVPLLFCDEIGLGHAERRAQVRLRRDGDDCIWIGASVDGTYTKYSCAGRLGTYSRHASELL
ncbi:hypothetical protein IW262DRAFT_1299271 [Armillaria fumosa]|nr:hypothetical protein IW262DRAFT_1299265 [Armillaria fumosa]KAK0215990.1 hypothetical protein IW262DRAFT_1299268 [Armillaria fumosa]KAK0215993.1 hypothetical protein IW262DRAFT_1299271 [Armillaria fumosa]